MNQCIMCNTKENLSMHPYWADAFLCPDCRVAHWEAILENDKVILEDLKQECEAKIEHAQEEVEGAEYCLELAKKHRNSLKRKVKK